MSVHYLISIKQQLHRFVSASTTITYPLTLDDNESVCSTKEACLALIESSDPNQAVLIAIRMLPIYTVLPKVITSMIVAMLLPADRIELSHCCRYFRSMIMSPHSSWLSDLWLYVYHIPLPKAERRSVSKTRSALLAHSAPSAESPTVPSPSHATSLPNTLATSTAMSSRQDSARSLFPKSSPSPSPSSHSQSASPPPPKPQRRGKYARARNTENDEDPNRAEEARPALAANGGTPSTSSSAEGITTLEKCSPSESAVSSTDPLLEHPSTPTLTSKIIYWPNYKQVLACDFPAHFKRRNPFYQNLCVLGKNCGGAHIRCFEVGMERLPQILSHINPCLLSLCFLNIRRINLEPAAFRRMRRLSYIAYQYITKIKGDFRLHIPQSVVALELTSCSFHSPCFVTDSQLFPNVKFLQICNCRFTNYSFQRLLTMCPNVVHISITTSSWDGIVAMPSSALSIIWKHNQGDFTMRHCHSVWEVSLTIYDSAMIEQLENVHSLKQLVIATPLFKAMDFLSEMEKPWSFSNHQITPFYNATSPSIRSLSHISLSPNLPAITHRMSSSHPIAISVASVCSNNASGHSTIRTLNNLVLGGGGYANGGAKEMELGSVQSVSRSVSNLSVSSVSLDSDDENEDAGDDGNDDNALRIVCFQDLIEKPWFTNQFQGDRITFDPLRRKNPLIEAATSSLNPIFVREMKQTTMMFHISFPFF